MHRGKTPWASLGANYCRCERRKESAESGDKTEDEEYFIVTMPRVGIVHYSWTRESSTGRIYQAVAGHLSPPTPREEPFQAETRSASCLVKIICSNPSLFIHPGMDETSAAAQT